VGLNSRRIRRREAWIVNVVADPNAPDSTARRSIDSWHGKKEAEPCFLLPGGLSGNDWLENLTGGGGAGLAAGKCRGPGR